MVEPVQGGIECGPAQPGFCSEGFAGNLLLLRDEVVDQPVRVLVFHLYSFPPGLIIVYCPALFPGTLLAEQGAPGTMDSEGPGPSFPELVRIADCVLEESDGDEDALVRRLQVLPGPVLSELLVSDLLNAWQVFYYFFRTVPDELVRERLELEPASSLPGGVKIDEIELLDRIFRVHNGIPEILVSDGKEVLRTFSGPGAVDDSLSFIGSTL